MKKIIFCLTLLVITLACFSQAPKAFNYQALLRDSNGSSINFANGSSKGGTIFQ